VLTEVGCGALGSRSAALTGSFAFTAPVFTAPER